MGRKPIEVEGKIAPKYQNEKADVVACTESNILFFEMARRKNFSGVEDLGTQDIDI
ncbi:hypothetical protein JCM9140_4888 [Halalkalibacter wakoensis JCM 9140]|uniref:Uncharacterized protein n=1 Tax=Halalkalibacter wakoensis JCM 9140 TaxID=1236970 RepID=W4Q9G1_9BACI|nr:hypothetical protein JCM9140_4888 [Halalkalibacter wakoensis JCM 9140]